MQENLVPKFARYFAIPPKLSWKAVRSFEINWFKWTCKVFEWLKKVPVFCHGFTNYIAVDPRWTSAIIKGTFYLSTNYPKIKKGAATVMHKNTHALTHTHTQTTWKYCHLLKEINFDTLQFLGQRWVPRINFKHISPNLTISRDWCYIRPISVITVFLKYQSQAQGCLISCSNLF